MPYATVNGHALHYTDTAKAAQSRGEHRIPIVMVHGLGSSQDFYLPVIAELPNYRCIAMDTYGAARSKSQGEDVTIAQLGEDVIGLMNHLNIPKAVLVGHSMAGEMICVVAAAHSDRVAGIVCIGPVNPSSVSPQAFKTRIDTVMVEGMEPLADAIPYAATGSKSTPLHHAFIRELILSQDSRSYASHCQAILTMQEPSGGFEKVQCPALILAGEEDKSAPLEGCRYILDHLGSTRKMLKVMNGVGHWHCIEAGQEVAQAVVEFCDSF